MANKRQIIVQVFHTDGTVTMETSGFEGKGCKAATLPYEKALGTVTSDVTTAEGRVDPTVVKNTIKNTLG